MSDALPSAWGTNHGGRLTALVEVALAAGESTLAHFQSQSLQIERKQDDSPVTIADREAEQLTRKTLAEWFPDDTLSGEEYADTEGSSAYRWTVDPIDGTKSFICGVPLYSTLLALEFENVPIAGAIIIPALGESIVASLGLGCFHRLGDGPWTSASVSKTADLSEAVFVTSEAVTFSQRGKGSLGDWEVFERLQAATRLTRTWGDGYGYLLVATGRADVMVDPICNAWDVAPMVPILSESGGRFTDWTGDANVRGGDGLGTNGLLHDAVFELLSQDRLS
ncbi:MAG: inositol monophosphatase family protein [Planctomycetota bacterium]